MISHLRQRCSNDIVMVNVRAQRFCRIEPQGMNEIEIAGVQGWRVRADMKRFAAPALVNDDEPYTLR